MRHEFLFELSKINTLNPETLREKKCQETHKAIALLFALIIFTGTLRYGISFVRSRHKTYPQVKNIKVKNGFQ